jgi:hypothetical protein
VDSVVSDDGRYFFQHYSGRGEVGAYVIERDGRLTPIPDGDGLALPKLGSTGLVGVEASATSLSGFEDVRTS